MTKWAAADVPVRIPRAVVTVPVEGAIVDTVVHVTPGNDQPLVSLHPTILFISCSHFRRHPSSMIFPLYFSFAGRFQGGGNPPCPPRNGYFRPRGRPPDVPVRIPRAVVTEPGEGANEDTVVHVTPGKDQLTAFGGPVIVREIRSRRTSRIDCRFQFPAIQGHIRTSSHIRLSVMPHSLL